MIKYKCYVQSFTQVFLVLSIAICLVGDKFGLIFSVCFHSFYLCLVIVPWQDSVWCYYCLGQLESFDLEVFGPEVPTLLLGSFSKVNGFLVSSSEWLLQVLMFGFSLLADV